MRLSDLSLDDLQRRCEKIHYFGLGFIQLKLNFHERIHFYTTELPRITPWEEVHNHRYNFHSQILSGRLTQQFFKIVAGNDHIAEEESCQEGVASSSEGRICSLERTSALTLPAGSSYWIDHETLHRVEAPEECITFLTRSEYLKEKALVVRHVREEKVCPFSQKVPEARLWAIVERMLRGG